MIIKKKQSFNFLWLKLCFFIFCFSLSSYFFTPIFHSVKLRR